MHRDRVHLGVLGQAAAELFPAVAADFLTEDAGQIAAMRHADRAGHAGVNMRRSRHRFLLRSNSAHSHSALPIIAPASRLSKTSRAIGYGGARHIGRNAMSDNEQARAAADRPQRAGGTGDRARLHVAVGHLRAERRRRPAIELIQRAVDLGVDHFDSSDMYGWGQNEELLGRALKGSGATRSSSRPSSARRRTRAAPTASTAARNTCGRPAMPA